MTLKISAAALRDVLEPFGRSRMLPAEAYTSEEIFAWEQKQLFDETWVCVGHSNQLPAVGSQVGVSAGTTHLLLVRSEDGIRGFLNVCQHRGHELLGCGESRTSEVVKCPYHGWVYGLDGCLQAVRHLDEQEYDPAEQGLVPVATEEWLGWLFVNASGTATDMPSYTGTLTKIIAPYCTTELVTAARHDYLVDANWKLIHENYQECYHCPIIHPELCQVSSANSGFLFHPDGAWLGGSMDLNDDVVTMSLTGAAESTLLPGLPEAYRRWVLYLELFPNLLISAHPDYVMTHRLEPLACDRTRIECCWLFPCQVAAADGFDSLYATEFWDITNRQDWAACEAVQRGMSTGGYSPGPLSDDEEALYHHVVMLAHAYERGGYDPHWAKAIGLQQARHPAPELR